MHCIFFFKRRISKMKELQGLPNLSMWMPYLRIKFNLMNALVTLIVPGSCHSGRLKLNAGFESTAICCSLKSIDFKRQCTLLKKLPKIRETAAAPCPVLKSPLCCLTLNFNRSIGIFGDEGTGLLLTIFWQIS